MWNLYWTGVRLPSPPLGNNMNSDNSIVKTFDSSMTLLKKGMSVEQIAKLIPISIHKDYILSSLYFNNKQYKEAIVHFIKSSENGVFAQI